MAKSIVPKLVIAYNFARTAIADLLSLAQTVFTNMAANAAVFTTPPVSLAKLKSDVDNLMISSAAATEGAKKDIIQRDKDRHALEQDLLLLGAYVIHVANGDPAILASSGFAAKAPRTRAVPQSLEQPAVDSIDQGNSGQFMVWVTSVEQAKSYEARYAALANGMPGTWTTVAFTGARKPVTINGLTPGTTYAFQVRALGSLGFTDWSDSATRMCI